MNDRQDPYGQFGQPGQIYGYDEYGRPIYGTEPQQPPAQGEYDYGYGTGGQQDYGYGYGQDTGQQAPVQDQGHQQGQYPQQDQSQGGYGYGYGYGYGGDTSYGTAPAGHDTGQQAPVQDHGPEPAAPTAGPAPATQDPPATPSVPPARGAEPADGEYQTEQFAFVEEEDGKAEDVIDWLKFSESRTERREEAKRRGRTRKRLLVVLLVLAVLGGVGYLYATDRLPFLADSGTGGETATGAQVRDVVVVHLRPLDSDETSTVLLVGNETTETGTTLLLPNELSVTPDGGTTTLGQAVANEGAASVREAVGGLLGADIQGTWRLDTPYLETLVELVGGITLTTDAEVPGEDGEDPLVPRGEDVQLAGRAAVAYATLRGEDEPGSAQLARFGQVLQAVLEKLPADEAGATRVVEGLNQIVDPSLTEDQLGNLLARLAGYAQGDAYETTQLPVEVDGSISDETAEGLVSEVLGGTVSNADPNGAPRIGVRDASGVQGNAETARIALVNGGFTVVDSRAAGGTEPSSQVVYGDEAHRETALEAARTLGLPEEAVTQGDGAGNVDVTIILGEDYGG
ncbi:LCP family protein [Streptomyces millisiae]|uniref:LCP family protein n=1 Tax=Streptomyces millisiae TaxID=3075542 RepID=A0ABU2LNW6_9ACTN|nr:LCP family protein [Streptomyces sp. DSM 44918]MDT0319270.1 LCP family protein [Streptomyces sp. DSM 44918]